MYVINIDLYDICMCICIYIGWLKIILNISYHIYSPHSDWSSGNYWCNIPVCNLLETVPWGGERSENCHWGSWETGPAFCHGHTSPCVPLQAGGRVFPPSWLWPLLCPFHVCVLCNIYDCTLAFLEHGEAWILKKTNWKHAMITKVAATCELSNHNTSTWSRHIF